MSKKENFAVPPCPPQLLEDPDYAGFGPKMQALTPRKRAFCWYYAHNGGNARAAYRLAYPDAGDTTVAVESSRRLAEVQIREALADMAKYQFDGLVMPAIAAILPILTNPGHKQHFKAVEFVLDRRGFQPVQQSKVEVVHKLDAANVDAALLNMAAALGINFAPKAALPAPIDITPTEVIEDEEW